MAPRPRLIGSEIYRQSRYGGKHPLAIPRVSAAIDLIRALGWLNDADYIDSPVANPDQLARFHDPGYIAAVIEAEAGQDAPDDVRHRHGIGMNGNPIVGEIFKRPATACGATLKAVQLLQDGGIVHSPAGGTHHGRRDRASGFCYFNDPVLGILSFLDFKIAPVLYIDIDAHHGDGVEDAFVDEPRVTTVSIHESGRWPGTGMAHRLGQGAWNFPVPAEFNDSEFRTIFESVILPLAKRMRPQAIVFQCGADSLAEDPLSKLALSNRIFWWAVEQVMPLAPRLLVLGGGGYNPWSVARCWAGIWATINQFKVPDALPDPAQDLLAGLSWSRTPREPLVSWTDTLADPPREGEVRPQVRKLIEATEI